MMKRHNTLFSFRGWVAFVLCGLCFSPLSHAIQLEGKLHWSKRVELGMPVSGVIKQVSIHTGDKVKKNTSLVQLDERSYRADLMKAKAILAERKELQMEANRELDRAQQLYDRTMLSEHDLQIAKNAKVSADSAYLTAQAELVQAELNLEYATLRAPFDGIILQRHAEVGQTVVSQLKPETLVVLAAAGEMLARGYIPQSQLKDDMEGQSAIISVNGQSYQGKVKSIGLEPVKRGPQNTTHYEITIAFPIDKPTLRAGQAAVIHFP